jgi:acetyl-CoA acetyltransferase
MANHPYSNVAITAAVNTRNARSLPGYTSLSLAVEASLAALDAAGLDRSDIDGVTGPLALELTYALGLGPVWATRGYSVELVGNAANAIACGQASNVLVVDAAAGTYTDRGSTAPWTRPTNEFVVSSGLFTVAEFGLIARRHMELYGTTPEAMATVAATIRNNGSINPNAVYYGRGPYTVENILNSRMVADPYHLLDCCTTSEGGAAVIMTSAERARDLKNPPVYVLGWGLDFYGPAYQHPPSWDLKSTVNPGAYINGWLGRRAAEQSFAMAGLKPADVQTCEFYDNFSFEIIRQYESFGFCAEGEGNDFVLEGNISIDGKYPVTTDGGLMSMNHSGTPQSLQRVVRCVHQIQGICETNQLPNVDVAMASAAGAGALRMDAMLLGSNQP